MNKHILLNDFQKLINYNFINVNLLEQALTTPQYGNEMGGLPNYQVLETLGDAVIKLIFSTKIFEEGINSPGEFTRKKANFENDETLNRIAKKYFNLQNKYFSFLQFVCNNTICSIVSFVLAQNVLYQSWIVQLSSPCIKGRLGWQVNPPEIL